MLLRVVVGRVRSEEVADPAEHSPGADPETWSHYQPEDAAPYRAVVDLADAGDDKTQDSGSARILHNSSHRNVRM